MISGTKLLRGCIDPIFPTFHRPEFASCDVTFSLLRTRRDTQESKFKRLNPPPQRDARCASLKADGDAHFIRRRLIFSRTNVSEAKAIRSAGS